MITLIKDISRNRLSIPVAILLSLVLSGLTFWFVSHLLPSAQPDNSVWIPIESLKENLHRGVIVNFLVAIAGSWGIFKLNEAFSLSHYRTYLPFLFYLLLQVTNPSLQFISEGTFTMLLGIPALAVLFTSYQRETASGEGFRVGILLGILSIFWSKGLLYAPLFLIGFWLMRSWNLKIFTGALLGVIAPFWIQFSWMFFKGDSPLFFSQFEELSGYAITAITAIGLPMKINLGLTFLLATITGSYLLVTNFREKVRTQAYYNFLILLSIYSAALCIVDSKNITGHLTWLYISEAFLISNIFIKVQTKLTTFLFLLIIGAYLTAYVFNLWIN
ncbi:MAG: hypothetical protein RR346_04510 [Bacteroidales bacterium]